MAVENQKPPPTTKNPNGLDEREIRVESGKAAQKSQEFKRRAYELRQAAHGAADADERQKLLEEAIDNEFKAESFGKTAKYLRSGTFQGMAVGTGIGVVPGLTLGTLTGVLVGGVTSMITGGLGAGVGALAGAIHGPFWNMGKVLGKGVRKITGDLPSWVATDAQKETLEKMMGQIKEEDMPDDEELDRLRREGEADDWWDSMYQSGTSYMPSMPSWMKGKKQEEQKGQNKAGQQQSKTESQTQPPTSKPPKQGDAHETPSQENIPPTETTQNTAESKAQRTQDNKTRKPRGKPRKLEVRSANAASGPQGQAQNNEKRPRKIERRS